MKTILALVTLLSVSAFAQSVRGTPPDYCKPCLFYGGDFDAANSKANGLLNTDALVNQGTAYVPFAVPAGQEWTITGLFSNNLSNVQFINPAQIEWSISSGVSEGNPGTLIASGVAHATWTPTGRSWQGLTEYTALGRLTPQIAVTLTSGQYWMTAVPVCTAHLSMCQQANYSISDVEDTPPPNHKGVEPGDQTYYSFPADNLYYVAAWVPKGPCGGVGCDKFSAGLLGYAKPSN